MLQVVVKLLGKEIDMKGSFEDVKGILAELEFSTRPAESRTGVRVSLEDSVVSDPGIKGKAWEDWRGCDRWCSGRATGGSGATQSSWPVDQKVRHLEGQKRGDGGRAGLQASILDFFAPRRAMLSLKLERQTSILEFFGPTRGEAQDKTAEAKVAGAGAAEAKTAQAKTIEGQVAKAAEATAVEAKGGGDQQRPGRSQQGEEVSSAGQCDGDREEASATRPKGQQGLIKTLEQAGLDYRGEVHAPCASEGGANPGRIAEGLGGNDGLVQAPAQTRNHNPHCSGEGKEWLDRKSAKQEGIGAVMKWFDQSFKCGRRVVTRHWRRSGA